MIAMRLALAALLAALLPAAAAFAQPQGILGTWWTKDNKGRVEIVKCAPPAPGVCGRIIWISEPLDEKKKPQTDKLNPDPKLKGRPIVGMPLFEGWRESARNAWQGKIYDPERGETFDIDITLRGDQLTIKGCVLFFCESETWVRFRG